MTSRREAHSPHAEHGAVAGETGRRKGLGSLQWWPAAAGLAFAAYVALDLFSGEENGAQVGPIVAASGLVYIGAAALQKRATAWLVFFASVIVITIAKIFRTEFEATWTLLALAGALLVYGLLRGATRPADGLPLQAIGMAAFGAVAATALIVNEVVGAYLVAAGLLAHAGWDAYHHWTDKVVARSMAEFCFVLDTALAVAIVAATVRG